ncbi:MAG: DUF2071 domain-containing protein [Elusimicrobia bacterium]|nr:DUF2071 domain-containing protein [Elusimicrobiota bacterium]
MTLDCRGELNARLRRRPRSWMTATTTLRHFALINYAVPAELLRRHIPADRFDIPEFDTGAGPRAFLSVVPFLDVDFTFPRLAPFHRSTFYQTNHRAYVIDRATGQHAVWFFGTNLGSPVVYAPRLLWRLPWHFARYSADCRWSPERRLYDRYRYHFDSPWCRAEIELEDAGRPIAKLPGFSSLDEMKLILTHPIAGFFRRLDGVLGTYGVWHPEMAMTTAAPRKLYFSLYEDLGLLSRQEMSAPHSVFLCPEVEFEIDLPPRRLE